MKSFVKPMSCIAVLVALAPGCRAVDKKQAMDTWFEIQDACEAGDKDKASTMAAAARNDSEIFKAAFDASTPDVPDKATVDPCSLRLVAEVPQRIDQS